MANENYRILDERDLNELEKEDKSLKEGILKNEKSINDIKEDVVELQGNVSNMSESIRGIKDDIISIEDELPSFLEVDTFNSEKADLNERMDVIESNLYTEVEGLRQEINDISISDINNAIAEINENFKDANGNFRSIKDVIETQDSNNQEFDKRLDTIDTMLGIVSGEDPKSLSTIIEELNEEITGVRGVADSAITNAATAQNTAATAQNTANTAQNTANTAKETADGTAEELKTLKGQMRFYTLEALSGEFIPYSITSDTDTNTNIITYLTKLFPPNNSGGTKWNTSCIHFFLGKEDDETSIYYKISNRDIFECQLQFLTNKEVNDGIKIAEQIVPLPTDLFKTTSFQAEESIHNFNPLFQSSSIFCYGLFYTFIHKDSTTGNVYITFRATSIANVSNYTANDIKLVISSLKIESLTN